MSTDSFISHFIDLLVRRVAAGLKIPEPAIRMFQKANELSGLDRKTLPTELIPLNTIQLSRGLLNFTLFQSLEGWVFPYWAERQYDPSDPGFIPRSHLGLSINITRRNWTAVGNPGCSAEPVVDPRGAVMPIRNRWTSECWLKSGGSVLFPSRAQNVRQTLRSGLPIVDTHYEHGPLRMDQTVYMNGPVLVQEVAVVNAGTSKEECTLAFAIRPFNAEGACLLGEIRFDAAGHAFVMDGSERFVLPGPPDEIHCSNHAGGDSAAHFSSGARGGDKAAQASCESGLANGYAAYTLTLAPGDSRRFRAMVSFDGADARPGDVQEAESSWNALLDAGTQITTPDEGVNAILRASLSTLLLLTDGDSITPGPWTYHQFWFRDAALMLRTLDAFGFHGQAGAVIRAFPTVQEGSGYFRSQQGEWDSNGQALWTAWQHAALSGNTEFLPELMDALGKGADWIARKRTEDSEPGGGRGLMPPGLSAEHLGLADEYFWDNWWSAAGLEAYARLCTLQGMKGEEEKTRRELKAFREDIERAVKAVRESKGVEEIPAGPSRGVDCGMIGSCAPWYPLQEYLPGDARMVRTLETLTTRHILDGLFFQEFIHSGKNPYLTLHIAQAWLYGGERNRFWRLLTNVIRHASPTLNFPEAIHPFTGGGTMGDGHHGWAAAELAFALRSALVLEIQTPAESVPNLVLLGGAPTAWFVPGRRIEILRAPVSGGSISLEAIARESALSVEIEFEKRGAGSPGTWLLKLPGDCSEIRVNGSAAHSISVSGTETTVTMLPTQGKTRVSMERQPETVQPANL